MSASSLIDRLVGQIDCCPWGTVAGRRAVHHLQEAARQEGRPLYTAEERRRRDASGWTTVQGVLAPVQFLVFLVSLALVLHTLATGEGLAAASASVVVKTFVLYAIMVTGAIWEKEVFGRYLFAPVFFWEDAFSILVLALHTAYLAAIALGWGSPRAQLFLALAAYAAYVINAAQFVVKLRAARLQAARQAVPFGAAR
ncbi:2-vinyl bacteriochlorophyllide hydratase [Roseomonas nepalensis]|uniref:2-vinyl bacteriochlorophyllide hydratase n=1 Tax=Muricoccus nepalensis TaxID=1854500 RepID=A0A502GA92_9PROT|nr:2-vinyl bacteriochlorophyllide hydratase [Roseomonas nepalensis]TPG58552.1 2-vinyl bacteriochlorophyllide hydratase [Roseomonas nepalensis]